MRLGYLVPEFPGQTHAFFWREVGALRARGVHVQLLSTRRPPPTSSRHAFSAVARDQTRYLFPPSSRSLVEGLRHSSAAWRVGRYLASLTAADLRERSKHLGLAACALELLAVCRELSLDHVHVHSLADAAHLASLAREWGGTPYSLTLHGDLDVYGSDHQQKVRGAAFVAAVTRPLQEQLVQRAGVSKLKAPVIWMGVETDRFQPSQAVAEGPIHLVTVARLNRQKGHVFALRALRKCLAEGVAMRYTIAGAGDYEATIKQQVSELGLTDAVTFTGTLAEDEVLKLLHSAHAFVLPSVGLGEAAPVSVMEAMSCGLAVVCSRIGGTPDMIRSGVDGHLVDQEDVDGLTSAFLSIARDRQGTERLRHEARATAVVRFDHHVMAQHLAWALEGDLERASLQFPGA